MLSSLSSLFFRFLSSHRVKAEGNWGAMGREGYKGRREEGGGSRGMRDRGRRRDRERGRARGRRIGDGEVEREENRGWGGQEGGG